MTDTDWDIRCSSGRHGHKPGPCTDIGMCGTCWGPATTLRRAGETYGLHADDCASPERHYGPCTPGGTGHPVGDVRGYWPGKEDDIEAARARHGTYTRKDEEWDF